tara:strand:- start:132 stop:290 length:159 start_codon:yes stop_codon:yes gene_type:complete
MGGPIMIKNLIILSLIILIIYDVSSDQALNYVQTTLDIMQELLYNVMESKNL